MNKNINCGLLFTHGSLLAGAKGVRAHNAYADLVTALDGLLASFYDGGEGGPDAVFQRQTEAAHAAQKALDRHRRPT